MKNQYIKPDCKEWLSECEEVIMVSGVVGDGVNVDYGGVDENGELEPSSNSNSVWDDQDKWRGHDTFK